MTVSKPAVSIIVAMTSDRVIGRDGHLPWSLPEDLKLFRRLTLGGTLIMGRRTWESLPGPLDGRRNLVLSRSLPETPGIRICRSWPQALQAAETAASPVWVIGGASVYRRALPATEQLHVSWVHDPYRGNCRFPVLLASQWELVEQRPFSDFTYCHYRRRRQPESIEPVPTRQRLTPPFDHRN